MKRPVGRPCLGPERRVGVAAVVAPAIRDQIRQLAKERGLSMGAMLALLVEIGLRDGSEAKVAGMEKALQRARLALTHTMGWSPDRTALISQIDDALR